MCEMGGGKFSSGKETKLYVLRVYCLPAAQLENTLTVLELDEVPNLDCGICILGDININGLAQSIYNTYVCK